MSFASRTQNSKRSRYHIFKTSPTRQLLYADSQARNLRAGNLNVLSLPGASVRHFYNYLPPHNLFDLVILFVGGNDLYNYTRPTLTPATQVADDIVDLENFLSERASNVFVIGVPERDENKTRSKSGNDLLLAKAERKSNKKVEVKWIFRNVANFITGNRYFTNDHYHLNEDGLNNLKNLIKRKILYKKYSKHLNDNGHLTEQECPTNNCQCTCRNW